MTQELTPTQQEAVTRIRALRALTRATGTRTTRSVNAILRSLSDDDLTTIAPIIEKDLQQGN